MFSLVRLLLHGTTHRADLGANGHGELSVEHPRFQQANRPQSDPPLTVAAFLTGRLPRLWVARWGR